MIKKINIVGSNIALRNFVVDILNFGGILLIGDANRHIAQIAKKILIGGGILTNKSRDQGLNDGDSDRIPIGLLPHIDLILDGVQQLGKLGIELGIAL